MKRTRVFTYEAISAVKPVLADITVVAFIEQRKIPGEWLRVGDKHNLVAWALVLFNWQCGEP